MREAVCLLVREGSSVTVAAAACGVESQTVAAWLCRGERGGMGNGRFIAFCAAVARARGEAETALVGQITAAASQGSWQAAAWLLERGFDGWTRPSIQPRRRGSTETPNAGTVPADPFAELDNVEPIVRGPRRNG